jgi:hypothetical protein
MELRNILHQMCFIAFQLTLKHFMRQRETAANNGQPLDASGVDVIDVSRTTNNDIE